MSIRKGKRPTSNSGKGQATKRPKGDLDGGLPLRDLYRDSLEDNKEVKDREDTTITSGDNSNK